MDDCIVLNLTFDLMT